jgi:hypothetical protein
MFIRRNARSHHFYLIYRLNLLLIFIYFSYLKVRFLNEDEVIAAIGDAIQERLAGANSSRVFLTQVLLIYTVLFDYSVHRN